MNYQRPDIYLIDNGSLRPDATLFLRRLASVLSLRSGYAVEPVSLLHSHKVPADQLGGQEATILKRRLKAAIAGGQRSFILLPLFLGPSRAITEYIPEVLQAVRPDSEGLQVIQAEPLCGARVDQPDRRLATILKDHVLAAAGAEGLSSSTVALVDHGTPAPEVNELRNAMANQLNAEISESCLRVVPASMERRVGPEYDFNEPLLENLQSLHPEKPEDLIVAMFFLLPGRHAGPSGDVAEICQGLRENAVFRNISMTGLIGEHPLLPEILHDRLQEAIKAARLDEQN